MVCSRWDSPSSPCSSTREAALGWRTICAQGILAAAVRPPRAAGTSRLRLSLKRTFGKAERQRCWRRCGVEAAMRMAWCWDGRCRRCGFPRSRAGFPSAEHVFLTPLQCAGALEAAGPFDWVAGYSWARTCFCRAARAARQGRVVLLARFLAFSRKWPGGRIHRAQLQVCSAGWERTRWPRCSIFTAGRSRHPREESPRGPGDAALGPAAAGADALPRLPKAGSLFAATAILCSTRALHELVPSITVSHKHSPPPRIARGV